MRNKLTFSAVDFGKAVPHFDRKFELALFGFDPHVIPHAFGASKPRLAILDSLTGMSSDLSLQNLLVQFFETGDIEFRSSKRALFVRRRHPICPQNSSD